MDDRELTLLVVDDDPGDVELLRRHLGMIAELKCTLLHAATPREGLARLEDEDVDAVFLDFHMGGETGLGLLEQLRLRGDLRPVVVLTGQGDEYIAVQLTRAGADDYLTKADLDPPTLRRSLDLVLARHKQRVTEAKLERMRERAVQRIADANVELAHMSRVDSLTKLVNRAAWDEAATIEHERSSRYGHIYSILMLDVDYFKKYNDSQGHQAGDECLRRVAQLVRQNCRSMEVVGRYGGEEFIVLAPETGADGARTLAERIRKAIWDTNLPHGASGVADRVTVSIGVAAAPAEHWEDVVKQADEALYAAKNNGRNRVSVSTAQQPAEAASAPDGPLVVLAIDDDEGDAEILRRHLGLIPGMTFEFLHCIDSESARGRLAQGNVGLLFTDYQLGTETGLDVVKTVRSSGYLGPIIAVTGQGNEYVAVNLTRAGADDYVAKSDLRPDILERAINNARAQVARRNTEAQNRRLLAELQMTKKALESKNARLSELYEAAHQSVDNVSHEFRTPLTVIKEFTSIIRDGLAGEVTDEQREYLEIVLNRVDDLSTMVDDMLDISKLEAGVLGVSRRECEVADIIKSVRTTLERKAVASKVTLDVTLADDLQTVYCDPEKIGRVIINLTVNALKFSNEGGHVNVWVRRDVGSPQILIGVTDDGPGIAPENLRAIFERFRQVESAVRGSTKGFGLGLNIAKELVHLNFGDITVESEVGQGSTFSFTVPVADPSSLLSLYFKRTSSLAVSLLSATVTPVDDPELLEEVTQFLQRQLRRSDLLFQGDASRWLIVAATREQEVGALLERLETARLEANRNRPSSALPEIKIEVLRACEGGDQTPDFIRCFAAEYRSTLPGPATE